MLLYILGLIISLILASLTLFGFGKTGNRVFIRRDSIFSKKTQEWIINSGKACNIIEIPKIFGHKLSNYAVLSFYTLFYGYTWSYLVLSKVITGKEKWNGTDTFMTIILFLFTSVYSIFQYWRGCHWNYEGFSGFLFGLVSGLLWNILIKPDLNEQINKNKCYLGRNNVWSCEGTNKYKIPEKPLKINDYIKFSIGIGIISIFYGIGFYVLKK